MRRAAARRTRGRVVVCVLGPRRRPRSTRRDPSVGIGPSTGGTGQTDRTRFRRCRISTRSVPTSRHLGVAALFREVRGDIRVCGVRGARATGPGAVRAPAQQRAHRSLGRFPGPNLHAWRGWVGAHPASREMDSDRDRLNGGCPAQRRAAFLGARTFDAEPGANLGRERRTAAARRRAGVRDSHGRR